MKFKVYAYFILIYTILFVCTLSFNFIEGDDATTVLYHLLDRNLEIQKPYSAYHSMFDTLLSVLPSENEWLLRHVSIGISFLFGLLTFLSLTHLIFLKSKQQSKYAVLVLIMLPFIIPETLFSSLIVNPTLLSFTFILWSHSLLIKYLRTNHILALTLAIVCFGIGVSFRWSNGFYLFVLFGDFILNDSQIKTGQFNRARFKKSLLIFPFFVLSVILSIQVSGYSIIDIYETYSTGSAYVEHMETSYTAMFATAITFLTPAFLLLLLLGFVYCLKNKSYRNLILLCFALLPYLAVGLYPSYKYMICVLVVLVLLSIQGLSLIKKTWMMIGVALIVFLPWLIGIQIDVNSAWGPGFEVKMKTLEYSDVNNFNPDKTIAIDNVNVVVGSGMAMPTPEGARPIYGFGTVFLKDWKDFVAQNNLERSLATQYAIDNDIDILQDVRHSIITSKLVEFGYTTDQHVNRKIGENFERAFRKSGDSVVINVFKNKNRLFKKTYIDELFQLKKTIVVYSTYSNIISKLETQHHHNFEQKGVYWGVLKAVGY